MHPNIHLIPPRTPVQSSPVPAIPRRTPGKDRPNSHEQIENRRDRHVFLLVDGVRSIDEIAAILGLSAVEVALSLLRLFERGYIEMVSHGRLDGQSKFIISTIPGNCSC